jgi:phosphoribosyl-ATP pyrophosphohydrolase
MEESSGRRVVCLAGSTRFEDAFRFAARAEALAGRVVVGPGVFSGADGVAPTSDQTRSLEALHDDKVRLADELLVIDVDGYIGEATHREIDLATSLGKAVRYWSVEHAGVGVPIDPVVALQESHHAQQLVRNERPTLDVPAEVKQLRCALIDEEAGEFRDAIEAGDIVAVADAIADLLYVVYGAALTFGIPVREVFADIHRSNMTKLDDDGRPVLRADGKVMKGRNYSPPNLLPILVRHGYASDEHP